MILKKEKRRIEKATSTDMPCLSMAVRTAMALNLGALLEAGTRAKFDVGGWIRAAWAARRPSPDLDDAAHFQRAAKPW